ncbi:histidine phosphatase family protein [Tsukamurella sp. 8F]|uniref:histidine phosphatase family protein n=1 Tax=unclassified Tsukamurella TaxID=2633480 RepID=UPI0023B9CE96|nr:MULTISPECIES: histidine phosphatase family protein [unclassified Tsukamurella]MDF0531896.1 histidine phosphatase family protein [Tsukamurella sp. 8J]MDF0589130.1 histidine phosphatase family protein [Tsukamurella sp. 8F]
MRELTLVAHAMTAATRAARFPSDEAIEPLGSRPPALASVFARAGSVLVAPERRAVETAAAFGADGAPHSSLRDQACGEWAGLAPDDVPGEDLMRWLSDPAFRPPGGESAADVLARVGDLLAEVGSGRAVAVTHPVVLRAAAVTALGAPPEAIWSVEAGPLATMRLVAASSGWRLRL